MYKHSYDRRFDFNHDGKLSPGEYAVELQYFENMSKRSSSSNDDDDDSYSSYRSYDYSDDGDGDF